MKQKHIAIHFLTISIFLALSACSGQEPEDPTPTNVAESSSPVAPTATPLTEPVFGLADVESLEILTTDSIPAEISVRLRGVLPEGCAEIDNVIVEQDGDVFDVAVITVREPGQTCTGNQAPFEETVPLDTTGLDPGSYTVVAAASSLPEDLSGSFTLDADDLPQEETDTPSEEEAEPTPAATATAEPANSTVSGRVWHDLCSSSGDQEAVPADGCVLANGSFQANGLLEDEPGIEGVRVHIGEGQCPSEGIAIAVTNAEGDYNVSDLASGTYCLSVNATEVQNQDVLLPGRWTAPENGIAESTITLGEGDAPQDVNFGWDYQFLPAAEIDLATCSNSFEFVEDINIPDDTVFAPGADFTKRWQLQNNGTCPWSTDYTIVFVGGDQMSAEEPLFLAQAINPGQPLEVVVDMVAPDEPGSYRGNWQIADADGQPFGIDGFIEDAFWLRIAVAEDAPPVATALPNSGVIGGVVWDDFCINSDPGRGCIEFPEDSDIFIADGSFGSGELPLSGVTIGLARDACPEDGTLPSASAMLSTAVTDADGLYGFANLPSGTYCIFMDALSQENVNSLIPGNWTWPGTGVGRYSFILDPGEQALDLDFGWDYVD
jgi:hypothetical protein